MLDLGYGNNMALLGKLTYGEKATLITQLNAFPGHRVKLMSVFEAIRDVFFACNN